MKETSITTTLRPQPVSLEINDGITIRLVDTPGYVIAPPEGESGEEKKRWSEEEEAVRAKDALLRSRGKVEKMKSPEIAGSYAFAALAISSYDAHGCNLS